MTNVESVDDKEGPSIEEETLGLLKQVRNVMRGLGVVVAILLVLVIGLEVQIQDRNRQLDKLEEATGRTEDAAGAASAAASKASTDLSEAIARSGAGSQEAAAAVRKIFEVVEILCEVYPETVPCAQGG